MKNKLSTAPVLNKRTVNAPKILSPEDSPIHLQDLMDLAREAGQKSAEGGWNLVIHLIHEKLGKSSITGNDALSLMTTCVTYYMATWIVLMRRMADNDEAGIEVEEMIEGIIQGTKKLIKSAQMIDGVSK